MGILHSIIFIVLILNTNNKINKHILLLYSFHQNHNIIVLGATNRPQDLDRALLRPGRFDIQVNVSCKLILKKEKM